MRWILTLIAVAALGVRLVVGVPGVKAKAVATRRRIDVVRALQVDHTTVRRGSAVGA